MVTPGILDILEAIITRNAIIPNTTATATAIATVTGMNIAIEIKKGAAWKK